MSEKGKKSDWKKDLKKESIDKSAEMNILPNFKINLGETAICIIKELPVLTAFADGNSYFTILLEKEKVIYQFNCNAKSFRFSLAVLEKKHGNLIDKQIAISKSIGDTKEFKKAELYSIQLIE